MAKCPTCRTTIGSIRNRPLEKLRARAARKRFNDATSEYPAAAPPDAGLPQSSPNQRTTRSKLPHFRLAPRTKRGLAGGGQQEGAPFAFAVPAAAAAGAPDAPPAAAFAFSPGTAANISVPGGYRFTFDPAVPSAAFASFPETSAAAAPPFGAAASGPASQAISGSGHGGSQQTAAFGAGENAGVPRADVPPASGAGCTSPTVQKKQHFPAPPPPMQVFGITGAIRFLQR